MRSWSVPALFGAPRGRAILAQSPPHSRLLGLWGGTHFGLKFRSGSRPWRCDHGPLALLPWDQVGTAPTVRRPRHTAYRLGRPHLTVAIVHSPRLRWGQRLTEPTCRVPADQPRRNLKTPGGARPAQAPAWSASRSAVTPQFHVLKPLECPGAES